MNRSALPTSTALRPSSQSNRAVSACNGVANRRMVLFAVNAFTALPSQPTTASILPSLLDKERTASSHQRFATSVFMAPRVHRSSETQNRTPLSCSANSGGERLTLTGRREDMCSLKPAGWRNSTRKVRNVVAGSSAGTRLWASRFRKRGFATHLEPSLHCSGYQGGPEQLSSSSPS